MEDSLSADLGRLGSRWSAYEPGVFSGLSGAAQIDENSKNPLPSAMQALQAATSQQQPLMLSPGFGWRHVVDSTSQQLQGALHDRHIVLLQQHQQQPSAVHSLQMAAASLLQKQQEQQQQQLLLQQQQQQAEVAARSKLQLPVPVWPLSVEEQAIAQLQAVQQQQQALQTQQQLQAQQQAAEALAARRRRQIAQALFAQQQQQQQQQQAVHALVAQPLQQQPAVQALMSQPQQQLVQALAAQQQQKQQQVLQLLLAQQQQQQELVAQLEAQLPAEQLCLRSEQSQVLLEQQRQQMVHAWVAEQQRQLEEDEERAAQATALIAAQDEHFSIEQALVDQERQKMVHAWVAEQQKQVEEDQQERERAAQVQPELPGEFSVGQHDVGQGEVQELDMPHTSGRQHMMQAKESPSCSDGGSEQKAPMQKSGVSATADAATAATASGAASATAGVVIAATAAEPLGAPGSFAIKSIQRHMSWVKSNADAAASSRQQAGMEANQQLATGQAGTSRQPSWTSSDRRRSSGHGAATSRQRPWTPLDPCSRSPGTASYALGSGSPLLQGPQLRSQQLTWQQQQLSDGGQTGASDSTRQLTWQQQQLLQQLGEDEWEPESGHAPPRPVSTDHFVSKGQGPVIPRQHSWQQQARQRQGGQRQHLTWQQQQLQGELAEGGAEAELPRQLSWQQKLLLQQESEYEDVSGSCVQQLQNLQMGWQGQGDQQQEYSDVGELANQDVWSGPVGQLTWQQQQQLEQACSKELVQPCSWPELPERLSWAQQHEQRQQQQQNEHRQQQQQHEEQSMRGLAESPAPDLPMHVTTWQQQPPQHQGVGSAAGMPLPSQRVLPVPVPVPVPVPPPLPVRLLPTPALNSHPAEQPATAVSPFSNVLAPAVGQTSSSPITQLSGSVVGAVHAAVGNTDFASTTRTVALNQLAGMPATMSPYVPQLWAVPQQQQGAALQLQAEAAVPQAEAAPQLPGTRRPGTQAEVPAGISHDDSCVVCMEKPRGRALAPCGHRCMCEECAEQVMAKDSKCPLCCRTFVTLIDRIIEV